ncbi:MAG: NADH-quinone oxidoreductase subunit J family protein [Candidatus Dormibacteraceae bacterium]
MWIAPLLFLVLAAISVVAGVCVVAFRQPLKSVLALVVVMLALAILFLLLEAQFVFIVQVIVYTGAVMVLFLFVVALLGPLRETFTRRLGRWHLALALVVAIVFFGMLFEILGDVTYRNPVKADLSTFGSIQSIGAGLFGDFLYPFELTSVLLVVAAIGAIYLSRGGRTRRPAPRRGEEARSDGGGPAELPARDRAIPDVVSEPDAAPVGALSDEDEHDG